MCCACTVIYILNSQLRVRKVMVKWPGNCTCIEHFVREDVASWISVQLLLCVCLQLCLHQEGLSLITLRCVRFTLILNYWSLLFYQAATAVFCSYSLLLTINHWKEKFVYRICEESRTYFPIKYLWSLKPHIKLILNEECVKRTGFIWLRIEFIAWLCWIA